MQFAINEKCFNVRRFVGDFLSNRYGGGTGRIWLDDVNCNGSETDIGNCSHRGWGSHNCHHTEDVSIRCTRVTSPCSTGGKFTSCVISAKNVGV